MPATDNKQNKMHRQVFNSLYRVTTSGFKRTWGFFKKPNPVGFLGFGVLLGFLEKQEK